MQGTVSALGPIAQMIEQDPNFAWRLQDAVTNRGFNQQPPPQNQPPPAPNLQDELATINDKFFESPAASSARVAEKLFDTRIAPSIRASEQQMNIRLARSDMQQFATQKSNSDPYAPGILPEFNKLLARMSDTDLANLNGQQIQILLGSLYAQASDAYFRGRAGQAPRDTPPPATSGGNGSPTPSAPPKLKVPEATLRLGRALGRTDEEIERMYAEENQALREAGEIV